MEKRRDKDFNIENRHSEIKRRNKMKRLINLIRLKFGWYTIIKVDGWEYWRI